MLRVITIIVLSSVVAAQASTVVTYPKADYTQTSSVFSLTVNGTLVNVEDYYDYHYAHLSFSGKIKLQVTASETITSYTISPKSFKIAGTTNDNTLSFSLSQPRYLVLQINNLENLVILADPLETDVPDPADSNVLDITEPPYNADKTGATDMRSIIQEAIDDVSAIPGGATVYVPAGVYLVYDRLFLKSNVALYLAGGAVLRGSPNRADQSIDSYEGLLTTIEGTPNSNIRIFGRGVLDASAMQLLGSDDYRRRVLVPYDTSGLTVEGVILRDSTSWTAKVTRCDNISFKNVKVVNATYNTSLSSDGINMCGCQHAVIEDCFVYTLDDAFCSKAMDGEDVRDVHFKNSVVWTRCAGVKAGMQAESAHHDIWFENIDVIHCSRGIAIMHKTGENAIEDIHFIDIRTEKIKCKKPGWHEYPIEMSSIKPGATRNIEVTRVSFENKGPQHSKLKGYSSTSKLENVTFTDLYMAGELIMNTTDGEMDTNAYVSGITFEDSSSSRQRPFSSNH